MKIVNLKEKNSVDNIYKQIKCKLVIYHSTDEFKESEYYENAIMLHNYAELMGFIQDVFGSAEGGFGVNVMPTERYNVWLFTNEKEIKLQYSHYSGGWTYFLINGERVATDGGWIRLIAFKIHTGGVVAVYTSSGIWQATSFKFAISMAEKTEYRTYYYRKSLTTRDYQSRLYRLMEVKYPREYHYRVIMAFMHPLSPAFGDI